MFAYCGNDPVIRKDSAGDYWETALDIFFILVDIYILAHDEGWKELENWAALALDVAFTAIPVATGGGLLVKGADRLGDLSKITVIGESMDRVSDFAKVIGGFDNLYGGLSFYEKLADSGRIGQGIGTLLQLGDNGLWLLNKLRNNYKIVDIGFDLSRIGRSEYYAVEQFVMTLWEHRHELKALLDILLEENNG